VPSAINAIPVFQPDFTTDLTDFTDNFLRTLHPLAVLSRERGNLQMIVVQIESTE